MKAIPFCSRMTCIVLLLSSLCACGAEAIESAEPTSLTLAWEYATPQLFPQALVMDQKGRDSLYVALKNGGLGILDISKYESGSFVLQPETMDLHATVAETMNILLPQAAARQLDLAVFVDAAVAPMVVGSPWPVITSVSSGRV